MNIFGGLFFITLTCLAGITTFAYFADKGCDPMTNGQIQNTNQIIPYFVMEVLAYPGVPGLFVASLFSGALSSVSSSLNALSAVSWESILKPHLAHRIAQKNHAWVTRATVVLFGAAGMGMAFIARGLGGTVLQAAITFNGAANGPILGIFFLGAVFPFANWIGASVGTVSGLTFVLWIGIGSYSLRGHRQTLAMPMETCQSSWNASDAIISSSAATTFVTSTTAGPEALGGLGQLYSISYLWYTSIGFAITVLVGLIVSVLTGPTKPSEVDPKYTIPIFHRLCCCMPRSIRRTLRCGIDEQSSEDMPILSREESPVARENPPSPTSYGQL